MRITSTLAPKAYLATVKEQMSGHFELGAERFTGFFLGPCFHVTHHAGHEWNRRYTNEKNAAVGYVRKTEDGCELRFILFKGFLCPAQFLFWQCLFVLPYFFIFLLNEVTAPDLLWPTLGICCGFLTLFLATATFFESLTERSEEGRRILLAFLIDPNDPFSYLNNRNQIP